MNQKQRDILCKMVKDQVCDTMSQLEKYFPKHCNRYEVGRWLKDNPSATKILGNSLVAKHNDLSKQADKLSKEQEKLGKKWDDLNDQINDQVAKQQKVRRSAIAKLNKSLEEAVISIQFADNADTAKAILAGLPTVEDLLS